MNNTKILGESENPVKYMLVFTEKFGFSGKVVHKIVLRTSDREQGVVSEPVSGSGEVPIFDN